MAPWTIIPAHGLSSGKSRLSAVLSDARRRELNAFFLEHVTGAVGAAFGGLQQCIITSPCEDTVALAAKLGAIALAEPAETGLNRALDRARLYAKMKQADRIVVLPCDLPRVTAAALVDACKEAHGKDSVIIVPDRRESGTNLLALPAALDFRFAFGVASFPAHAAEAARLGARVEVRRIPEIAFDIDEAEDLNEWRPDPSFDFR